MTLKEEQREAWEQMLPTPEFEEYFATEMRSMEKRIAGSRHTDWMPQATLLLTKGDEGKRRVTLMALNLAGDLRDYMAGLGAKAARDRQAVTAILLSSEMWHARYESQAERDTGPQPKDHPQRTESLALMGLTLDGRAMYASWPIRRAWNNRITLETPNVLRSWEEGGAGIGHVGILERFRWAFVREVAAGRMGIGEGNGGAKG